MFDFLQCNCLSRSISWIKDNYVSLSLNVIGGLLAVGFVDFFRWVRIWYANRKFRHIFGNDIDGEGFYLVYGELSLPTIYRNDGIELHHPYTKPGSPGAFFTIEQPISGGDVRAMKYLAESLTCHSKQSPKLCADSDIKAKLDRDGFCCRTLVARSASILSR